MRPGKRLIWLRRFGLATWHTLVLCKCGSIRGCRNKNKVIKITYGEFSEFIQEKKVCITIHIPLSTIKSLKSNLLFSLIVCTVHKYLNVLSILMIKVETGNQLIVKIKSSLLLFKKKNSGPIPCAKTGHRATQP